MLSVISLLSPVQGFIKLQIKKGTFVCGFPNRIRKFWVWSEKITIEQIPNVWEMVDLHISSEHLCPTVG